MEHTDAVKLQAVEKYILGELPPSLREEFEAHYFDCAECSLNLRTGVAFAAVSRQYFAETAPQRVAVAVPHLGWFSWLKPLVVVPTFVALLLVIGYQNIVSIPRLRQISTSSVGAVAPWFSLAASSVHGSAGTPIEVQQGQGFHLFFDITNASQQPGVGFLVNLQDSTGKVVLRRTVSAKEAQKAVIFDVPRGLPEGDYKLVVLDQSAGSKTAVSELPFTVAFSH
jgi:hypothetical protein